MRDEGTYTPPELRVINFPSPLTGGQVAMTRADAIAGTLAVKVTGPCRPALVAWEPIDPASLTEGAP